MLSFLDVPLLILDFTLPKQRAKRTKNAMTLPFSPKTHLNKKMSRTANMIAASVEIARRAYKRFQKGWIYPGVISTQRYKEVLGNQWKEELEPTYMSWKGLAGKIKEQKLKYRFQLNPSNAVFRTKYNKRHVEFLTFFDDF